MQTSKAVLITVTSLLLVALITVGGWQLGWWLKAQSANRNAKISQQSFERQTTLVEQILQDLPDAQNPALPAEQRQAITSRICDAAAKLTGTVQLPAYAITFTNINCTGARP